MEMVHIARDGRSLGKFTKQDVADGVATGKFFPRDLLWCEGMPAWISLQEYRELPAPSLDFAPSDAAEDSPPEKTAAPPAWENRRSLGFWFSLYATCAALFSSPLLFFEGLVEKYSPRPALTFYILMGTLFGLFALGYAAVMYVIDPVAMAKAFKYVPAEKIPTLFFTVACLFPLMILMNGLIGALLTHGMVIFFSGGRTLPFSTTLRVYCYSYGAASVFYLLPGIGTYIVIGVSLGFTAVGLRQAHKIGFLAANFSAMFPPMLLLSLLALSTNL